MIDEPWRCALMIDGAGAGEGGRGERGGQAGALISNFSLLYCEHNDNLLVVTGIMTYTIAF